MKIISANKLVKSASTCSTRTNSFKNNLALSEVEKEDAAQKSETVSSGVQCKSSLQLLQDVADILASRRTLASRMEVRHVYVIRNAYVI